ncbi:hypothetical protein FOA52_005510 [Chlamydomonas sp. UWO 241]|nr:hypothetical protein FOA52_005510 [Chlamydomonas sp. UWO 241]
MLILGFDHAAWSNAYNTGQAILAHYKAKGAIPDTKLFESSDLSVLKLLIEHRAPEGEVHRLREPVKNLRPIPADDPRVVALIRDHPGQVLPPTEFADRPGWFFPRR